MLCKPSRDGARFRHKRCPVKSMLFKPLHTMRYTSGTRGALYIHICVYMCVHVCINVHRPRSEMSLPCSTSRHVSRDGARFRHKRCPVKSMLFKPLHTMRHTSGTRGALYIVVSGWAMARKCTFWNASREITTRTQLYRTPLTQLLRGPQYADWSTIYLHTHVQTLAIFNRLGDLLSTTLLKHL